MKVTVIGSGYVGLVTGACFAEFGAHVTCVDVDGDKIAALNAGRLPIYEPGLAELMEGNRRLGRLHFTADYGTAVPHSDLVFIAVGTPSRADDGCADLRYVHQAAAETARHLQGSTVVVMKSTVPVGTAEEVRGIIRAAAPEADFDMAANPEFLRQGSALADFMQPDRVVIGIDSQRAAARLKELYRPLSLVEVPLVVTSLESAELIKYAANAFLAAKVSFINEIAYLCEAVGADVHAVARGMGLDSRIGRKFLQAGPGFGGSCFPKDAEALVKAARQHGIPCRIVESVIEVNEAQKARMVEKIIGAISGSRAISGEGTQEDEDLKDKTVAVLGLTFKPETDDMRAAPSLSILSALMARGVQIRAHDPQGAEAARRLLPETVQYYDDVYDMCRAADAAVLMTEWTVYRGLDLKRLSAAMRRAVFVDLRNVYDPDKMRAAGFDYHCVGRGMNGSVGSIVNGVTGSVMNGIPSGITSKPAKAKP